MTDDFIGPRSNVQLWADAICKEYAGTEVLEGLVTLARALQGNPPASPPPPSDPTTERATPPDPE